MSTEIKAVTSVIAENPPRDGAEWECQCARCGSSMYNQECEACGGDGHTAPGELYEQDPLWYDRFDVEPCHQCGGDGSWMLCMSTEEYCKAHPLPGRGDMLRHTTEWFRV